MIFQWRGWLASLITLILLRVGPVLSQEQQLALPFPTALQVAADFVFKTPLNKQDVVLIGGVVSIDEELKTYGGDVLILADRLGPVNTIVIFRR